MTTEPEWWLFLWLRFTGLNRSISEKQFILSITRSGGKLDVRIVDAEWGWKEQVAERQQGEGKEEKKEEDLSAQKYSREDCDWDAVNPEAVEQ